MPAGLDVDLPNLSRDVREAQASFERFAKDAFPRAVQFTLNRVAIDGTNRWRKEVAAGQVFERHTPWTERGVQYRLDRQALSSVRSLDDVRSEVYVPEAQSAVFKYAFGEDTREPGDVGIEGLFANPHQIYVPFAPNLAHAFKIRTNSHGNVPVEQVRRVAQMAADGYRRNAAGWGVFEVKPGDRAAQHLVPGIYARPPRTPAYNRPGKKAGYREVGGSQAWMPGTMGEGRKKFTDARFRPRVVPRMVNLDQPRILFQTLPSGHYEPVASRSWAEAMQEAASQIGGWLEDELAQKMEKLARQAGSGRGW